MSTVVWVVVPRGAPEPEKVEHGRIFYTRSKAETYRKNLPPTIVDCFLTKRAFLSFGTKLKRRTESNGLPMR